MPLPWALVSLDPSLRDASLAAPRSLRRLANRVALGLVAAGEDAGRILRAWAAALDAPVSVLHPGEVPDADLFRGLAERARLAPARLLHASADATMLAAAEAAGCAVRRAETGMASLVAAVLDQDALEPLPPHPLAGRQPEPYLRGIQFFQAGRFYEAHEEWERLYVEAEGPERDFWRGLIQVAAACHQARRGNDEGAARLERSARILLAPFLPRHRDLDIQALLDALPASLADGCRQAPTLRVGAPGPSPS